MSRASHPETLFAPWLADIAPVTADAFHPAEVGDLIRLGRDHDGGYVVSRASIATADTMLSFGVNDDVSFEAASARLRPGLRIHCFDPTVSTGSLARRSLRLAAVALGCLLAGRPGAARRKWGFARRFFEFTTFLRDDRHSLHRLWVADADGPGAISVGSVISRFCDNRDRIFVKMDIEGLGYACLEGLSPHAHRIAGLAVEFHTVVERWPDFVAALDRLGGQFCLAHAHGNNFDGYAAGTDVPNTLELSFVFKALLADPPERSRRIYPLLGLDMPNHHRLADMAISFSAAGPP